MSQEPTFGIMRDRFFYPILTRIMDTFSCSPLNTSFYNGKREKEFQKPEYAELRHGDVNFTLQCHGSACRCVAVCFYLSHGLV